MQIQEGPVFHVCLLTLTVPSSTGLSGFTWEQCRNLWLSSSLNYKCSTLLQPQLAPQGQEFGFSLLKPDAAPLPTKKLTLKSACTLPEAVPHTSPAASPMLCIPQPPHLHPVPGLQNNLPAAWTFLLRVARDGSLLWWLKLLAQLIQNIKNIAVNCEGAKKCF